MLTGKDFIDSYIKYYDDIVSENLCNKLMSHSFPYEPSAYSTHDSGRVVKEDRVKMHEYWVLKDNIFYNDIKECFERVIVKYKSDFELFSVKHTTDFRINRYGKDGFMSRHVDNIHHSHGQQYGYPQVSVLLYLNDDYEGGEFHVANKVYCPSKGSAIIFPSNFMFPHEAKKVINGTRWSIVTWLM